MKLDTSFFKKNKKLLPLFIGGGVLLLGVIVFVLYWYVLGDVKPSYVRVTNQTDSSFTVSWVSTKKSKGQVLVREDGKFLPGVLAPLGADKFYDDRDVVKAELEAGEKRTEKATKEVEKSEDKVIDVNNYNFDVKVRKQGRYYVHTVTVSNLDSDTGYSFRIGNGFRWYGDEVLKDNEDSLYEFGAIGLEKMAIETLSLPEGQEFVEPNPSYGSVVLDENINTEDILLFSFFGDTRMEPNWESISMPLSSGLNDDFGWYIDQSNARFETGHFWAVDGNESVYQMMQFVYVADGKVYETEITSFFDYEMRPAGTINISTNDEESGFRWSFLSYAGMKKATQKGEEGTNSQQGGKSLKSSISVQDKTSLKQELKTKKIESESGSEGVIPETPVAPETDNGVVPSKRSVPVSESTSDRKIVSVIESTATVDPVPPIENSTGEPIASDPANNVINSELKIEYAVCGQDCKVGFPYRDGLKCELVGGIPFCVDVNAKDDVIIPKPEEQFSYVDPCSEIEGVSKGMVGASSGVCVPDLTDTTVPEKERGLISIEEGEGLLGLPVAKVNVCKDQCTIHAQATISGFLKTGTRVFGAIVGGLAGGVGGGGVGAIPGATAGWKAGGWAGYGVSAMVGSMETGICVMWEFVTNCVARLIPVSPEGVANNYTPISSVSASENSAVYVINDPALYTMKLNGELAENLIVPGANYPVAFFIDNDQNGVYNEGDELVEASVVKVELKKEAEIFRYNFYEGYNYVSFPFVGDDKNNVKTMSSMLQYLNSVGIEATVMATYDGGWKAVDYREIKDVELGVEGKLFGINDFPINPGKGYVIKVTKGMGVVTFSGYKVAQPVPVEMKDAWNLVGVHGLSSYDGYTADDLIVSMRSQDIPAEIATQWIRGRYESRIIKDVEGTERKFGNDFPIEEYKAYFVQVNGGTGVWEPEKKE